MKHFYQIKVLKSSVKDSKIPSIINKNERNTKIVNSHFPHAVEEFSSLEYYGTDSQAGTISRLADGIIFASLTESANKHRLFHKKGSYKKLLVIKIDWEVNFVNHLNLSGI